MRLKDATMIFDFHAPLIYALWRIEIVMAAPSFPNVNTRQQSSPPRNG